MLLVSTHWLNFGICSSGLIYRDAIVQSLDYFIWSQSPARKINMSYEMENVLKVNFIFVKVVNSRKNIMINPNVYGYMYAYKITLMTID